MRRSYRLDDNSISSEAGILCPVKEKEDMLRLVLVKIFETLEGFQTVIGVRV